MEKIVVNGLNELSGSIAIAGMKNAALPILYATLLVKGTCRLDNLPDTEDIRISLEILTSLGASINYVDKDSIEINTDEIKAVDNLSMELVRKLRASYYLLGSGLGRFGRACVGYPGGCSIGSSARPIDQHFKAFESLGAETAVNQGYIIVDAASGLHSTTLYFDVVTVGATVNMMLAAVLVPGLTVIENAAKEPHIVDLANFLNTCGANVKGAGTSTIKIQGVESLHGSVYEIVPDMIEAGTYMVAAAAAGGCVKIENVIPKHLEAVTAKLIEMGVEVIEHDDAVTVKRAPGSPLKNIAVKTLPYPGFPTDMQPQICALLCLAGGTSIVNEGVWDNRFLYVNELARMGASIIVENNTAIVNGGQELTGAEVKAPDLRGGAAVIIAALAAKGETVVSNIHYIERGYDDITSKLSGVGADIKKVTYSD